MLKPQVGHPLVPLNEEQKANLLHWVHEDLLISNCARHIGITTGRLVRLLERGCEDLDAGRDSEYAQLYQSVRKKQAEKISKLLYQIELCHKNWQALAWKLEKCFREEFGAEAPEFKELLEQYIKLREDFQHLKDSHGGSRGKLDSVGNQEAGSIAQSVEGEEREEDTSKED